MHVHDNAHADEHRPPCILCRYPSEKKIYFLVKKKRDEYNLCFSLKSWSQMVQKLHFPSPCDVPQQVGYRFFFFLSSPLLPLFWEMEKERIEEEVTVWSGSLRAALIRFMVEQTVFTDSDRERVCYRIYTVGSCEQNISACFCICDSVAFVVMQVLVCVCVSVFSVSVYTLRSSVLVLYCVLLLGLLYSFQGFLLPLLSLCPPTPCLLPYIRVNNSGQAETDKPPQGPLICTGVKEHIFSLRPLPVTLCLTLHKSVRTCTHL